MRIKWISFVVGALMALGTSSVFADHTETVIGAAIGGAAGAAIGNRTGGRNDAVVWSAIGGATGAMVGRSLGEPHERQVVVRERVRYVEDDHYVVVHRPVHVRHVYHEERPRYYKVKHHKKHHRHHHRDWDDD
jgi:outer membrane lipoprotein SlyB